MRTPDLAIPRLRSVEWNSQDVDLRVPLGGVKNSGVGREGGEEALDFFTERKNVCVALRP